MSRTNTTTIDGYDITLKREGFTLTFNLNDLFGELDEDGKMRVAEMVTWGPVLKEALRRLAFESDSWTSDDTRTREEWLIVIGKEHERKVQVAEESRDNAWSAAWALKEKAARFADYLLGHHGAEMSEKARAAIGRFRDIERAEIPAETQPSAK